MSEGAPLKLFLSWQDDIPAKACRYFIEKALKQAVINITADVEVEAAIRETGINVDRDTQGVGGWVSIVDTVFKKIDESAIFVPDLTFVGTRRDGRMTPNPNVLIECGWALKSLGHARVLAVMNVHFGSLAGSSMPFNLRHLRHPIQYDLSETADDETRRRVGKQLTSEIEQALRLMLKTDPIRSLLPQPKVPEPFLAAVPLQCLSRFRAAGQPIGLADGVIGGGGEIYLSGGSAMWFRLMPRYATGKTHATTTLRELMRRRFPMPMDSNSYNSWGFVRADDGFGCFAITSNDKPVQSPAVVFVFESGELWSINSAVIPNMREVPYLPSEFVRQLAELGTFLHDGLGVQGTYRWVAGIEGVKNRPLQIGASIIGRARGYCVADVIQDEGLYNYGESLIVTLQPFFLKILEKCGVGSIEAAHYLPKQGLGE